MVNNGDGGEVSKEDARQRFLENEIHKTTLKMTEVIINEIYVSLNGICLQFFQPNIQRRALLGGHGEEEV